MPLEPADLVDALNGTFGRHASMRASHAKGISVVGEFQASATSDVIGVDVLAADTKAQIVGRLSVGGGNPKQSDTSRTVRGFGLELAAGKKTWTLVMISAPVFFAKDAKQFVDFLAARRPDPKVGGPNPEAVAAFNAANVNTMPHQAYLKTTAPAAGYNREAFHSAHAYGLQLKTGKILARLELRPVEGRLGISPDEEKSLAPDFLFMRLTERLKTGPVEWDLVARIAAPADDTADVTTPWEGPRTEMVLGRVRITGLDADAQRQSRVFDPVDVPKGVTAPADPIFPLRSPAYAVSATRRN